LFLGPRDQFGKTNRDCRAEFAWKLRRFVNCDAPFMPTNGRRRSSGNWERFLKYKDLQTIVDPNPQLKSIEIANYGEVFLNPRLVTFSNMSIVKQLRLP
jgi:hypothetical protein